MSQNILSSLKKGVRKIVLNRPNKLNGITREMYVTLTNTLKEDANNDEVVLTILTGEGKYFSSGNDFKDMLKNPDGGINFIVVKDLLNALINYPKLIVAVVNGPAIGIGVTILGLCDIVYASENATFNTPFVKIALNAEGTSSFTFPFTFGRSMASEMIFLGRVITANEAHKYGFVSKVFSLGELHKVIEDLYEFGKLSPQVVKRNKSLIMENFKGILLKQNDLEIKALEESIASEEFINIMTKLVNKSKL